VIIAVQYAAESARVVIADADEKNGQETALLIYKQGGEAIFVPTDVRREEDIVRLMKVAYETYARIDLLINNAGKGLFKSLYDLTVEEWNDLLISSLLKKEAPFYGTSSFLTADLYG